MLPWNATCSVLSNLVEKKILQELARLHVSSFSGHPLRNVLREIAQGQPHVDLVGALLQAHSSAEVLLHPVLDKCNALPQVANKPWG